MANETRPRRESSGPPRIRKSIGSSGQRATDEQGAAGSPQGFAGGSDSPPAPVEGSPRREEAAADREPIRFIRSRDREQAHEPVRETTREPGLSVRERLARDRTDRDAGPIHREIGRAHV